MRFLDDITNFIFVENPPEASDIIFMPGDANPEIPERAARLFHEGYAPLLLPSGGVSVKTGKFSGVKSKADIYDGDYQTDCDFYTDVLRKNQVPESVIIQENHSGHTRDNAFFSHQAADTAGLTIRKAIICCKTFHARRCLMFYQMAFPEAELLVVPVAVYNINRNNWYRQAYGVERVLGELSRCGNQTLADIQDYLHRGVH